MATESKDDDITSLFMFEAGNEQDCDQIAEWSQQPAHCLSDIICTLCIEFGVDDNPNTFHIKDCSGIGRWLKARAKEYRNTCDKWQDAAIHGLDSKDKLEEELDKSCWPKFVEALNKKIVALKKEHFKRVCGL